MPTLRTCRAMHRQEAMLGVPSTSKRCGKRPIHKAGFCKACYLEFKQYKAMRGRTMTINKQTPAGVTISGE